MNGFLTFLNCSEKCWRAWNLKWMYITVPQVVRWGFWVHDLHDKLFWSVLIWILPMLFLSRFSTLSTRMLQSPWTPSEKRSMLWPPSGDHASSSWSKQVVKAVFHMSCIVMYCMYYVVDVCCILFVSWALENDMFLMRWFWLRSDQGETPSGPSDVGSRKRVWALRVSRFVVLKALRWCWVVPRGSRWNYNGCYQHMDLKQCGDRLNEVVSASDET